MYRKFLVTAALAVLSLAFVTESASAQLLRGRGERRGEVRDGSNYNPGYQNMPIYTDGSNATADQFNFPQGTSAYYSPSDSMNNRAILVQLHVPANAQVWFDGNATQQTGEFRDFISPPVDTDKPLQYELRVSWTDANGQKVDKTRNIGVRAGHRSLVDFVRPEASGSSLEQQNKDQIKDQNKDQDKREPLKPKPGATEQQQQQENKDPLKNPNNSDNKNPKPEPITPKPEKDNPKPIDG
jgi:uncharacterized protein (TIGR03000 family)